MFILSVFVSFVDCSFPSTLHQRTRCVPQNVYRRRKCSAFIFRYFQPKSYCKYTKPQAKVYTRIYMNRTHHNTQCLSPQRNGPCDECAQYNPKSTEEKKKTGAVCFVCCFTTFNVTQMSFSKYLINQHTIAFAPVRGDIISKCIDILFSVVVVVSSME